MIAALLVTLTLLVALAVTLREARVAREQAAIARAQKSRAEQRFNDVRKLANSLIFEVHDSIRSLPGATQARELLVSRALEYLDSLSREASGDPSLQRELAAAYERVGDVLGSTDNANVGDFAGASRSYAKALAIWESLAAANPTDVSVQIGLAGEYFRTTQILEDMGDFSEARETMRRAQPLIQKMAAGQNDPRLQTQLAGLYHYTARTLEKTGDFAGALQNYRQAAAILEPIAANPRTNVFVRGYLAGNYDGMAKMLTQTGRADEAAPMAAKALAILKQLSDDNPTNATLREYLAAAYGISANSAKEKGDPREALELYHREHEIFKELSFADRSNQLAALNFCISDLNVGEVLVGQGRVSEGLRRIREALAIVRGAPGSNNLWAKTGLSLSYSDLGMAYAALADHAVSANEKTRYWREARSWDQRGLDIWSQKLSTARVLDANGHDQVAHLTQQLAKCDAELRELQARPLTPRQ